MAEDNEREDKQSKRFEMLAGVIIAVFAAVLAVSGLGGNNTGKGQMVAQTEKGSAYAWYSSKSIKKLLAIGQIDTLDSLVKAGVIPKDQQDKVQGSLDRLRANAARYEREEREILLGSRNVTLMKLAASEFENEILAKLPSEKDKAFVRQFYAKDKEGKSYLLSDKIGFNDKDRLYELVLAAGYKSPNWAQDLNGELGKIEGANEWDEKSRAIADADAQFDLANLFLQLCLVLGAISIVLQKSRLKTIFFGALIATGIVGSVFTVLGFIASAGLVG